MFFTTMPSMSLKQQLSGKVVTKRAIATGGFSDVWEGEWTRPSDGVVIPIAIKYVKAVGTSSSTSQTEKRLRLLKRLAREAIVLSQITPHPHVVEFYGFRERGDKDYPCLITQFLPNGDLAKYLAKHNELNRGARLDFVLQCANGLAHLHSLAPAIIHGDLKPQNVILNDIMQACLCDFGLAKIAENPYKDLETTGIRGGSKGYDAFELVREDVEEPQVTFQTDVFAFGGLILAVLSGNDPYYKFNDWGFFEAARAGRIPEPKDHERIPEDDPLWELMRQCWSQDPNERPLIADVQAFLTKEYEGSKEVGN